MSKYVLNLNKNTDEPKQRACFYLKPSFLRLQDSRGFTLIELLAVIMIIALLIGILLPALAAARKAANQTASLSHLRQIGLGMVAFTIDHDGMFPNQLDTGNYKDTWMYRIKTYISDKSDVFRSPLDDDSDGLWASEDKFTSYALNAYVVPSHPPTFGFKMYQADNPSYFIFISEVISSFDENHITPQFWGDPVFTSPTGTNPHTGASYDLSDDRAENWDVAKHQPKLITGLKNDVGGARAFGDGHCGWVKLSQSFVYTPGNAPQINWYNPRR